MREGVGKANVSDCAVAKRMALTLRIKEVVPATPRTQIIRVDLCGHLFSYLPGQAVFVGRSGTSTRQAFSIATAPHEAAASGSLELLVRIDRPELLPLAQGEYLDVEGPVGTFTFPSAALPQRLVFIAGGTGIAPVRSMLRHALSRRHRGIDVIYSARRHDDFPYERELQALAGDGSIRLSQTVTRQDPCEEWRGPSGRISPEMLTPLVSDPNAVFFVCGPLPLVRGLSRSLSLLGIGSERIRTDEW